MVEADGKVSESQVMESINNLRMAEILRCVSGSIQPLGGVVCMRQLGCSYETVCGKIRMAVKAVIEDGSLASGGRKEVKDDETSKK